METDLHPGKVLKPHWGAFLCHMRIWPPKEIDMSWVSMYPFPGHSRGWGRRTAWIPEFKTSLNNFVRSTLKKKKKQLHNRRLEVKTVNYVNSQSWMGNAAWSRSTWHRLLSLPTGAGMLLGPLVWPSAGQPVTSAPWQTQQEERSRAGVRRVDRFYSPLPSPNPTPLGAVSRGVGKHQPCQKARVCTVCVMAHFRCPETFLTLGWVLWS